MDNCYWWWLRLPQWCHSWVEAWTMAPAPALFGRDTLTLIQAVISPLARTRQQTGLNQPWGTNLTLYSSHYKVPCWICKRIHQCYIVDIKFIHVFLKQLFLYNFLQHLIVYCLNCATTSGRNSNSLVSVTVKIVHVHYNSWGKTRKGPMKQLPPSHHQYSS